MNRDCHYCENACCADENYRVDCYADGGFFDHTVINTEEAEMCPLFQYCDVFPKN